MTDIKCLAYQYLGAKQKQKELGTYLKKIERDLLDTQEISDLKLLLSNEGGQKTHQGISQVNFYCLKGVLLYLF